MAENHRNHENDELGRLDASDAKDRKILLTVLLINLTQSAAGIALGIWAGSTALMGAGLDNLADASVYAVSLYAVGRAAHVFAQFIPRFTSAKEVVQPLGYGLGCSRAYHWRWPRDRRACRSRPPSAVQQRCARLRVHVVSPVRVAQANGRAGTLMGRRMAPKAQRPSAREKRGTTRGLIGRPGRR
ncbi:TPA: hypothetical protein ACUT49_000976 [Pseudomonas aeruginosa]